MQISVLIASQALLCNSSCLESAKKILKIYGLVIMNRRRRKGY
jgi:hypothetical protein